MAVQDLSAKHFKQPLLVVLGDLSKMTAGVPINFEDTYTPIFAKFQIDNLDEYPKHGGTVPMPKRWVQWAFDQLKDDGLADRPARGQWALTAAGVASLQGNGAITAPGVPGVPTPALVPVAANSNTLQPNAQSVAIGTGLAPDYHPDPYIRTLATSKERTPCFGNYSGQAPTCKNCSAQRICINETANTFTSLAFQLESADMAAEKKIKDEAAAALAAKNKPPAPVQAPVTPAKNSRPVAAGGGGPIPSVPDDDDDGLAGIDIKSLNFKAAQTVPVIVTSVCRKCKGQIEEGSEMVWIRGIGDKNKGSIMLHPACHQVMIAANP